MSVDPGTTNLLTALAYGGGAFTAIGANDTVVSSGNGTTWQAFSSSITGFKSCNAIAWGNGIWVAVGNPSSSDPSHSDRILTSTDGIHWTQVTSGVSISLSMVAYGNGIFVAISATAPQALTSADGTHWSLQASAFSAATSTRQALAFGFGEFLASGYTDRFTPAVFYSSSDGTNWQARTPNVFTAITGLAAGGGTFIGVGGEVILQSDPFSAPSHPTLGVPRWSAVNGLRSTVTSDLGVSLEIQGSVDLTHWDSVTNMTIQSSPASWVDTSAVSTPHKFYRAVVR